MKIATEQRMTATTESEDQRAEIAGLENTLHKERARLESLRQIIIDYQEWLTAENADNLDGLALAAFDEERTDWWQSIVTIAEDAVGLNEPVRSAECRHCGRAIELDSGAWIDPEATGDDSTWRETCDKHDTFIANHEPTEATT